jgi:epoxyqueuosine reductase
MADKGIREQVLALARAEGFDPVSIASSAVLADARTEAFARHSEGMLADMAWMTDEWLTRSTDPNQFLSGARGVLLCALSYHSEEPPEEPGATRGRIARYARGRDYHRVFETKLRRVAAVLRLDFGAATRATVDYGPLLERPLAAVSGMGWLGKSTMLLVPGVGPWVLLGAIATDLELEPDAPVAKSCGTCSRCVVACPTGALSPQGNVLDARLCISYHTIENRGPIPRELRPRFGDWIFGCDDCLDSCPVGAKNFRACPEFIPGDVESARPRLAPLLALDEEAFVERFRGRPIMRAKRDGFLRNVCVALGNAGTVEDLPALVRALDDGAALVRGHAAWALGEMAAREGDRPNALQSLVNQLAIEKDPWVVEELSLARDRIEAIGGLGR